MHFKNKKFHCTAEDHGDYAIVTMEPDNFVIRWLGRLLRKLGLLN